MVIVFYLSFLLWGVTIGKGLMSYSLLLVNLMADDSISMSLLFGYLHKKHQMRRVTRFLWRLIRKQACGHRVRERIACFPNWLMGIEGDVVSCLYEIASFLSIIPVFLGDAIESWWDNFLGTSLSFFYMLDLRFFFLIASSGSFFPMVQVFLRPLVSFQHSITYPRH